MTRQVLDTDGRACNAFEVAEVVLVEVAAVIVEATVLAVVIEVEVEEWSGRNGWCRSHELSCKRYLVIMAASSPRLEVADDVVEAVPAAR